MTATLGDRSNSLLTFDTQRLVVWCVPTRGVVTNYGEGGGGSTKREGAGKGSFTPTKREGGGDKKIEPC